MLEADNNILKVPFSLETIIQGIPEISYAFSPDGRLLTWNKKLEQIFGYSKEELYNGYLTDFLAETDKDRVVRKFIEVSTGTENYEKAIEYNIKTKSGKLVPILAIRGLIKIEDTEFVIGIASVISKLETDNTELNSHITELINLKNQLFDYYHSIEKMDQAEVELKEKVFLNAKKFNTRLINTLPGVFYLFEKVDYRFLLKKWNKNFESITGYSENELLNMQLFQFSSKDDHIKLEKRIAQIFISGSEQIKGPLITKSGKPIQYIFEGHIFEDKGKIFFMGIGVDISIRHSLEQKQIQQGIDKKKSEKLLVENKKKLIISALQITKKNNAINYTIKQINKLQKIYKQEKIYNDLNEIKKELKLQNTDKSNDWEIFKVRFMEVHKDFFNNLKVKHPELTKTEKKYCAYMKINLTSTQIASILNASNDAIKKNRYRIRKKLNLSPKDSLEDYLSQF